MDKPGLHCSHCQTRLMIKGVCTVFCPNKQCPEPACAPTAQSDSILNLPLDIKGCGLVALDQPLFEVKHGPLGSDGAPEKSWFASLTDVGIENLPDGTRLFMQPLLATLQGVTDAESTAVANAWAVMIVRRDGRPAFFLDQTEARAKARLEHWEEHETVSIEIKPVRVHGLTASAFEEAQHYRASSRAFAQNAIDLQARCRIHQSHENALREKLEKVTAAVLALSLVSGGEHTEQWEAVHNALMLTTQPGPVKKV